MIARTSLSSIIFIISFALISMLASACSSADSKNIKSNCVNKYNRDMEIRWGYRIKDKNEYYGYTLKTDGKIYKQNKFITSIVLSNISREKYCEIYTQLSQEFHKSQGLNVPADTTVYIEYFQPSTQVRMKAHWNPVFKAVGSKEFRDIWNQLDDILPENNNSMYELRMRF